ncbi:MAG TPA: hypothetical protein VMX13_11175 [Sedimentisphaerales bacterium]|nr:hypothetical protein [Sedimentisphaerales bacterium]
MEKKAVLVSIVLLLGVVAFAQAQEGELHGSVDVTYQSKYIWRGFAVFGSKGAIQPSVDLDLYGTGFGINVMGHIPTSSGYVNAERYDYTLYYGNKILEDEMFATNYRLGWVYYNYPDNSSSVADLQELHAILSWPKVLGVEGLVPSYVLVKLWPSESGSLVNKVDLTTGIPTRGNASGWAHIFMLDYALTIPGLLPETPEQVLNLHSELVFNDGVGPAGQNADHDWSNAVFGASTDFDLGNNLFFTPGLYYQISMDDSVNPDDELWATLGMKYKF